MAESRKQEAATVTWELVLSGTGACHGGSGPEWEKAQVDEIGRCRGSGEGTQVDGIGR